MATPVFQHSVKGRTTYTDASLQRPQEGYRTDGLWRLPSNFPVQKRRPISRPTGNPRCLQEAPVAENLKSRSDDNDVELPATEF
jgi:hypothetical protein